MNKCMRTKVALAHLLEGCKVKIGRRTYQLYDMENYILCMVCECHSNWNRPDNIVTEKLLGVDYTLGEFIQTCEKMSESDYNNLVFNRGIKSK